MRALDLKSWFMWCALAGFGVVLPMMISNNPEHELIVRFLRALGAAGFIVGLVALFRSSGQVVDPSDAHYAPPPPAPRTLAGDPLSIEAGARPLGERIDVAIEASNAYDCTVGVIYYNLDSYREIARTRGVEAAEAAMDFVAGMLQIVLRDSDRIERLGRGRFVVCLVLLKDRHHLVEHGLEPRCRDQVFGLFGVLNVGGQYRQEGVVQQFDPFADSLIHIAASQDGAQGIRRLLDHRLILLVNNIG